MSEEILDQLYDCIIDGDAQGAADNVQAALDAGIGPAEILNDGMVAAMTEVGRMFENQECFVPEMLISARAMKQGMTVLRPHLVAADIQPVGKAVIGTVRGDLHDIGKNLVIMMLEGAGFEVVDLGVDMSPEAFVKAVEEHQPQIVGMSALLTTTMTSMRATVEALEEAGVRDQVAIMVGGAPVTDGFAEEIQADLFAPDASSAAKRARAWVENA
ncbi:MAG: corrinoid protein [Chloroflexota bacterium]|nr:corrinoid protein [Chloroflexota bacterium]